MKDYRDRRTESAETIAARVSGVTGKIMLVCYGNDDALCNDVLAGASLAKERGEPVGGIIRSQGSRAVAIYGGGFPLETHSDPGTQIQSQTVLAIGRVRAQLENAAPDGSNVSSR